MGTNFQIFFYNEQEINMKTIIDFSSIEFWDN